LSAPLAAEAFFYLFGALGKNSLYNKLFDSGAIFAALDSHWDCHEVAIETGLEVQSSGGAEAQIEVAAERFRGVAEVWQWKALHLLHLAMRSRTTRSLVTL
jgi:hypothetical protein